MVTTEKEIAKAIIAQRGNNWSIKENRKYSKTLDFYLQVFIACRDQKVDSPVSLKFIQEVVKEPDEFWNHCVMYALSVVRPSEEQLELFPFKLLLELIAVNYGVNALVEAYEMELNDIW